MRFHPHADSQVEIQQRFPDQEARHELDRDVFVAVGQDMYPVAFDKPRPIAQRTYHYLSRPA